ncbi:MAG: cobalamin-binding protein [Chitinivibrionales bacterium]|nr:cobalamin-binding protein [Chitinivibrionales bacterium]
MSETTDRIALLVKRGKINKASPFPPDLKEQDGADEQTKAALDSGAKPSEILDGCMKGMQEIGTLFSQNKVFVPDLLMSAKAMSAAMAHLKPHFQSGEVKRKGTFIIGTVTGDLHDIGKNLVSMVVEGCGWEIVDLGVDVGADTFLEAIEQHPDCAVGLSALLTTTMPAMSQTVAAIKEKSPQTRVLIGGAPITREFADKIGADCYSPDPQGAANYLSTAAA